jgi:hypothetical protein
MLQHSLAILCRKTFEKKRERNVMIWRTKSIIKVTRRQTWVKNINKKAEKVRQREEWKKEQKISFQLLLCKNLTQKKIEFWSEWRGKFSSQIFCLFFFFEKKFIYMFQKLGSPNNCLTELSTLEHQLNILNMSN